MPIYPNNSKRPVYLPNNGGVWVTAPATAQTQTQQPVTNPNEQINEEVTEVYVAPNVYRQFAPNAQPLQISSERANDSEELMQQIYEIDKQAFAETDPYENYDEFKRIVERNQLSTYAVKGDNDELLGYYQLEPIKNGDLYIDSIGLKSEYRNTRKGYQAIKYSWKKILDYAKENNVQTLSLHVDNTNRNLVRMYQSLGFSIKETLENYYENGAGAYFMERPLVENQQVNQAEAPTEEVQAIQTEEAENVEEPEISEAERIKAENEQKCQHAREELQEMGLDEAKINFVLKQCSQTSVFGHSKIKHFDDDIYNCCKYILQLEKDYGYNREVFPADGLSSYQISNILTSLKDENSNDENQVRTDLLPYLKDFVRLNTPTNRWNDLLQAAELRSRDGEKHHSREVLDFEKTLLAAGAKTSTCDIAKSCILSTKTGQVLDEEAKNCVKNAIYNLKDISDISYLVRSAVIEDEKGFESFDADTYEKVKDNIETDDYRKHVIYTAYGANMLKSRGVDLSAYVTYGKIVTSSDIFPHLSYETKEKLEPELFKACCYKELGLNSKRKAVMVTKFDQAAFNAAKELALNPFFGEKVMDLPKIIEACKEQKDEYSGYRFNPELLSKLEQLHAELPNQPLSNIIDIIEACKLKNTSALSDYQKPTSIRFNEEVFNTLLDIAKNGNRINETAVDAAKEAINGREYFNNAIYNQLADSYYWEKSKNRFGGYSNPYITDFFKTDNYGNKTFDVRLFNKFKELKCPTSTVCTKSRDKSYVYAITKFTPSEDLMNAYKRIKEGNYPFTKYEQDSGFSEDGVKELVELCKDQIRYGEETEFSPDTYNAIMELLEAGKDGRDVLNLIYNCKPYINHSQNFSPLRYELAKDLMNNKGIDIQNTSLIVSGCEQNGVIDQDKVDKCIELFNLGAKIPTQALSYAGDDEIAYKRLKDCIARELPDELIRFCKDRGEFKDRLYKMALSLQDEGFSPRQISSLMYICHSKTPEGCQNDEQKAFNYEMFGHIKDLLALGIEKENISEVLNSCNLNCRKFLPDAYEKVSLLHNMGIEDKGISKLLQVCTSNSKFQQETYDTLLTYLADIKTLRDLAHDDAYIIEKLNQNRTNIDKASKVFGQDVIDNVLTQKIDGFISFIQLCNNITDNCSEAFINNLNEKLALLPSPELKVKRLRVIGGLANKVSEESLQELVNMIKSPSMSLEQIKFANETFASDDDYDNQVRKFMEGINVPANYAQKVHGYLMKEKLNKQVNFPEPIDEQMAKMDGYAQQMLTNPKIPLDKKIKYIDEFKIKKADMEANPEKYTTPELFPKPLNGLKKVVMAYVNIPNDDLAFNNSITNTMYTNLGITPNSNLLREIHYDAKYFDKLFATGSGFNTNFKRLIELKQTNPGRPLTEIRMEMPEEGSPLYEKYASNGLLKQIEANLETKKQMEAQGIDFDKWNSFDPELKSEDFTVESDPKTEYENIRNNLINIFQDELFDKINPNETEKLKQHLSEFGYTLWNNNIFKDREPLQDDQLERFVGIVKNYIEKNDYWKSATENAELTPDEIEGITGFTDHLNGIATRIEQVKASRTVNDIHFRLTDDNDIGRNIFFGNHVSCCNSVNSAYAGYSAPMHLLNSYNRGVELVDKFGNSYGNSLCFFAMIDGKLTFVIDSFEANGKLGSNPLVTDELIKFGKQVCKEVGRSDAQIMIGPNYNNIDKSRLHPQHADAIKVLGSVSEMTYCDSVGGKVQNQINNGVEDKMMYVYI